MLQMKLRTAVFLYFLSHLACNWKLRGRLNSCVALASLPCPTNPSALPPSSLKAHLYHLFLSVLRILYVQVAHIVCVTTIPHACPDLRLPLEPQLLTCVCPCLDAMAWRQEVDVFGGQGA